MKDCQFKSFDILDVSASDQRTFSTTILVLYSLKEAAGIISRSLADTRKYKKPIKIFL